MKVLLSALACEPGKGSEPEVGFAAMLGAARRHEVWVLTNAANVSSIEGALRGDPLAERIHLEGIDFGVSGERFERLSVLEHHWYYERWQRKAAARAHELDRRVDFDVVHHVTLASYWTLTGAASLGKPLVWGPVGGGVDPPLSIMPLLGFRGLVEDAVRIVTRPLFARRPSVRRTQQAAKVTLVQNRATLRRIRHADHLLVLSNAVAVDLNGVAPPAARGQDLLFAGRLVPWKGPLLALAALRHVEDDRAVLRFFGEGPERPRLEQAARRWGLSDRVRFEGWVRRSRLLSEIARAGALIHPSLHDEASLAIAESLTLGTPVVCLDHGGPGEIVQHWPETPSVAVSPGPPERTARRMAAAVDDFLSNPPSARPLPVRPNRSFAGELLEAYELAAGDAL